MTQAQLDALTTMASWAESNLQGVTGTTTVAGQEVPRAAARMREQWQGADFGGMSQSQLRDRQKARRIDVDDIEAAMGGGTRMTPPEEL
jgi:hypothetical protein